MEKELYDEIRTTLNIGSYAIVDVEDLGNNVLYIKTFLAQGSVGVMYTWNPRFDFETNIRFIEKRLRSHVIKMEV